MVSEKHGYRARKTGLAMAAVVAAALACYVGALWSGVVTLIGYESRSVEGHGFVSDHSGLQSLFSGLPVVWLPQGGAIRADYDVEAEFGALELRVATPIRVQSATANIAGKRRGSVLFVAQSAGFYNFRPDSSPIGGPRCHPPGTTLVQIIVGDAQCPSYRLRYHVEWHLANGADAAPARIAIPARSENSIYVSIAK